MPKQVEVFDYEAIVDAMKSSNLNRGWIRLKWLEDDPLWGGFPRTVLVRPYLLERNIDEDNTGSWLFRFKAKGERGSIFSVKVYDRLPGLEAWVETTMPFGFKEA